MDIALAKELLQPCLRAGTKMRLQEKLRYLHVAGIAACEFGLGWVRSRAFH